MRKFQTTRSVPSGREARPVEHIQVLQFGTGNSDQIFEANSKCRVLPRFHYDRAFGDQHIRYEKETVLRLDLI